MSDVIIIGAGPAGLSASISCARFGLKVLVIDEFMKPGGRLLGQLHQEPTGEWWNGIEESKRLHEESESLSVHIRCGVSVYNLDRDENNWFVHTNIGTLEAPFVLLATGAAEYSIPLPGWTLPGVMSIGAAQVMTNVHRVQVGKKGIIIGIWGDFSGLAATLGPVLGGLFSENFNWLSIFFIYITLGIIAIFFAAMFITESYDNSA
ncbi:FAD-dependent oxidoreductase, partial [Bacillus vallismortis]|nr:FAD-dependent oxidoreductase [Bacillus vallismortis]